MATEEIITFEDALAKSNDGKRHLLLGNGFSIALKPDIFTYDALYKDADFTDIPHAKEIFDALETRDFEFVIKVLVDMARVLKAYEGIPDEFIMQINSDAAAIKTILVNTIANRHPDRPYDVSNEEYAACRQFLSHFVASKIYTLNYDVLLYWAMMHEDADDGLGKMCDDGFRAPEDDPEAPYVSWQESHSPSVYYLHGALHLFDAGFELQKYTWSRTDLPIVDQIREALDVNRYPLFVSEGHSIAKWTKIMHSAYLHKAARSLESIGGNIFIYGHSLDASDDHILNIIEHGKVSKLFVSIYGDSSTEENQSIINRAKQIVERREQIFGRKRPLSVEFFAAESAHVWG